MSPEESQNFYLRNKRFEPHIRYPILNPAHRTDEAPKHLQIQRIIRDYYITHQQMGQPRRNGQEEIENLIMIIVMKVNQ